jgi:hypothetical protein
MLPIIAFHVGRGKNRKNRKGAVFRDASIRKQ